MIDVKKELAKYKPIDISEEPKYDDVISKLLSSFNKTVERIGKDQYRSLKHMDDIVEAIEDKSSLKKTIEDMENKLRSKDETEEVLLEIIVEICDLTENMYIYSLQSQDLDLKAQMELQWKTLQQSLLKCGMTRFGNRGDIFDSRLYTAVGVQQSPDLLEGQILEVIKSGYVYNSNLLKKAEVVINATGPIGI